MANWLRIRKKGVKPYKFQKYLPKFTIQKLRADENFKEDLKELVLDKIENVWYN